MSTLSEHQQKFTLLTSKLIQWASDQGYGLTYGEAYRTPEQAALNAAKGTGIANSLHTQRLAVDLNLFKDGQFLQQKEDYAPLGAYWKSLDPDCCWGGDFSRPDSDHFSLTWQGVK